MASESITVTVFIKTLSGDLIELQVDPEKGLKGVEEALYRHQPTLFPKEITHVSFLNEEDSTLTNETFLMAVVSPLESIVRVDTFDWRGNTAYRLRIQADRRKSMNWMYGNYYYSTKEMIETRKNYPQLFDVCYYPVECTFRLVQGGESLESLTRSVGKRYKRASTALTGNDCLRRIVYRRDNVGLHEFDDEISKLPTEREQIDWSEFILLPSGIERISTLITQWISENL